MKFVWNVEEQKIRNAKSYESILREYTFTEKIEALRNYGVNINIDNVLNLRAKFIEDSKNGVIKETKDYIHYIEKGYDTRYMNRFNYASLKAWRKKNDPDVSSWWDCYDDYFYYPRNGISSYSDHSGYAKLDCEDDVFAKYINDLFYHMLKGLEKKERVWFNTHDEWTIERDKFTDRCHYNMGTHTGLSAWSSGVVGKIDSKHDDCRDLTLEELKAINEFYDNLERKLEEVTKEAYKEFPLDKNSFK